MHVFMNFFHVIHSFCMPKFDIKFDILTLMKDDLSESQRADFTRSLSLRFLLGFF